MQSANLLNIGQAIQLAVAPVFLLAGIGGLLTVLTNFGIPLLLGVLTGSIVGMLLSVGVLRLVLSHHFTFFINSLAHIWGKQPYTDQNTARDNGWLAFVTYGEGYHNFHHIFYLIQ